MRRYKFIIIILVAILIISFVICCVIHTKNKKTYDIDSLLSEIDEARVGFVFLPFIDLQHFQLQDRVIIYNEVNTCGVELNDYRGDMYSDNIRIMTSSDPIQTELCTVYLIKNEHDLSYIIKEDASGLLSLWEYNDVFIYNGYDFDVIVKSAFPDASVDLITKDEIDKIIYRTNESNIN